ncbi:MAG: SDR family NAD(P)-dependent oxidoreductase [Myxococcota bacterium]|nr:SDR family NAD(P)-dependent oxidoreductase [Myxococcota bacterium]
MSNSYQRVIVVGASSGIGEAIARQLASEGSQVALVARRSDKLEAIAADIRAAGGTVHCLVNDVRQFDTVAGCFDEAVATLGGLDLLVYASGVMPSLEEHEYDFSKDRAMMETNVVGAMAWLNPAAALMEAQRSGTLMGISSIAGERGRRGNPAYCTSKAAFSTYLESLRNRLGRYGVSVVTIKPGFIKTPMTEHLGDDLLWLITADEAARQILKVTRKGKLSAFIPARWALVAFIIRNIPSFVFRKLSI